MREAKGLRNRYNDLGKNITLREDSIQEMLEVMKQYRDRNDDLQTQLDWSRPVKAKLQEPIPTIRDVATLQELIDEHKVGWKLQNCFRSQYSGVNTQESILRSLYSRKCQNCNAKTSGAYTNCQGCCYATIFDC